MHERRQKSRKKTTVHLPTSYRNSPAPTRAICCEVCQSQEEEKTEGRVKSKYMGAHGVTPEGLRLWAGTGPAPATLHRALEHLL